MERQVQKPTNTSQELYTWSRGKALVDGSQAQENVGFHLLRVTIALTDLWLWNQFSLQIKQLSQFNPESAKSEGKKLKTSVLGISLSNTTHLSCTRR